MRFQTSRCGFDSYTLCVINILTEVELSWIAGILEGEGCFLSSRGYYPRISCSMTDEDVISKLQILCGAGTIIEMQGRKENWKLVYRWTLSGEDAIELMNLIFPLMFERRKNRIIEVIKNYDNWKEKQAKKEQDKINNAKRAAREYIEGQGSLREIGRKYKISHVTVKNYVNEYIPS